MSYIDIKNRLLKSRHSDYLNDEPVLHPHIIERQKSELEKVIYAINPLTGLPDSDLKIMSDSSISPTLRQAIQNINHVIEPNAPSSFDEDALLDNVQQPFESKEEYYDRLQQESDDYLNSQKKTEE